MIRCRPNGRCTHPPEYDTHTVSLSRPIGERQRGDLESQGLELYSVVGPVSPDDVKHDHHFRQPRREAWQ
jgi:hypothetical protein